MHNAVRASYAATSTFVTERDVVGATQGATAPTSIDNDSLLSEEKGM